MTVSNKLTKSCAGMLALCVALIFGFAESTAHPSAHPHSHSFEAKGPQPAVFRYETKGPDSLCALPLAKANTDTNQYGGYTYCYHHCKNCKIPNYRKCMDLCQNTVNGGCRVQK